VPGLAEPRVEALLRSLPKEARRSLIPIGATVVSFMEYMGAPTTNTQRLAHWLRESRGIPSSLIRFDLSALPAHLTARLAVVGQGIEPARGTELAPGKDVAQGTELAQGKEPARGKDLARGTELAQGSDVGLLRRRCAASARSELDRIARSEYPERWRRFELDQLAETATIDVGEGFVRVYPALTRNGQEVEVRFEWSREEALRRSWEGVTYLARLVLERQARDLAKTMGSDTQLLLAASPYASGDRLIDMLLQRIFRRACFQDAEPPRTRVQFETAVQSGRERLYPAQAEIAASARTWFTEARAVRRLLDDPRARAYPELAEETHAHLNRLLSEEGISGFSDDWIRQLIRYVKAEERRWQRLLARGGEPPQVIRELKDWSARAQNLAAQVSAEMRWLPQLDELHAWIEEYRVSMYAQELRTLGPVSALRLLTRVQDIEAWVTR